MKSESGLIWSQSVTAFYSQETLVQRAIDMGGEPPAASPNKKNYNQAKYRELTEADEDAAEKRRKKKLMAFGQWEEPVEEEIEKEEVLEWVTGLSVPYPTDKNLSKGSAEQQRLAAAQQKQQAQHTGPAPASTYWYNPETGEYQEQPPEVPYPQPEAAAPEPEPVDIPLEGAFTRVLEQVDETPAAPEYTPLVWDGNNWVAADNAQWNAQAMDHYGAQALSGGAEGVYSGAAGYDEAYGATGYGYDGYGANGYGYDNSYGYGYGYDNGYDNGYGYGDASGYGYGYGGQDWYGAQAGLGGTTVPPIKEEEVESMQQEVERRGSIAMRGTLNLGPEWTRAYADPSEDNPSGGWYWENSRTGQQVWETDFVVAAAGKRQKEAHTAAEEVGDVSEFRVDRDEAGQARIQAAAKSGGSAAAAKAARREAERKLRQKQRQKQQERGGWGGLTREDEVVKGDIGGKGPLPSAGANVGPGAALDDSNDSDTQSSKGDEDEARADLDFGNKGWHDTDAAAEAEAEKRRLEMANRLALQEDEEANQVIAMAHSSEDSEYDSDGKAAAIAAGDAAAMDNEWLKAYAGVKPPRPSKDPRDDVIYAPSESDEGSESEEEREAPGSGDGDGDGIDQEGSEASEGNNSEDDDDGSGSGNGSSSDEKEEEADGGGDTEIVVHHEGAVDNAEPVQ